MPISTKPLAPGLPLFLGIAVLYVKLREDSLDRLRPTGGLVQDFCLRYATVNYLLQRARNPELEVGVVLYVEAGNARFDSLAELPVGLRLGGFDDSGSPRLGDVAQDLRILHRHLIKLGVPNRDNIPGRRHGNVRARSGPTERVADPVLEALEAEFLIKPLIPPPAASLPTRSHV